MQTPQNINNPLLNDFIKLENVHAHGDRLYIPPKIHPVLKGLRVIQSGLLLGVLKKQRFEPSYALAMSLKDYKNKIDLPADSPLIARFLAGETFEISAADGYNLFCVEGYGIGFAKVLKNRVKGRII